MKAALIQRFLGLGMLLGLSISPQVFAVQTPAQTAAAQACCGCIAQQQQCLALQLGKLSLCGDQRAACTLACAADDALCLKSCATAAETCQSNLLNVCTDQLKTCSQTNSCPAQDSFCGCTNSVGSLKFKAEPFEVINSSIAGPACLRP